MATVTIDPKTYGELLREKRPRVIHDEEEHAAATAYVTELALKGSSASREELELMDLLATLIEDYERKRWPRKREKISGREMLQFLMEENKLKQADLADIASQPNLSAIMAGRRTIGPALATKLGKRFRLKPELFLDL